VPSGKLTVYKAALHLGAVRQGGSGAQLYKVNDRNETYIVKLKGNSQGIRVLYNEYVSGRLGEVIGVPFGEHVLVEVDALLHPRDGEPNVPRREPGIQFGTLYYPFAQTDIIQLRMARNYREFPSVVVFDTLIARGNGRQYAVYPSSGEADEVKDKGCIYDQGFAFTGSPIWSQASLQAEADCKVKDDLGLKQSFSDVGLYEKYIDTVEALPRRELDAIVHEAPLEEWGVAVQEANALAEWLDRRRMLLRKAVEAYLR